MTHASRWEGIYALNSDCMLVDVFLLCIVYANERLD